MSAWYPALGDHFARFVDRQVADGRYGSTSEIARAALHLLEEHGARLEGLRGAPIEGEQSGATEPFDFDALIAKKRAEGG